MHVSAGKKRENIDFLNDKSLDIPGKKAKSKNSDKTKSRNQSVKSRNTSQLSSAGKSNHSHSKNSKSENDDEQYKKSYINQNLFCPYYITKTGKKIHLPDFDEDYYIEFMEKLIFSTDVKTRRNLIMQPLPPQVSQLFFIIQRNTTLMNKMNPTFELYLEKGGGQKILILCASKKKFTVNNYYQI